jgi:hypothetical protein
MVWCACNVCMCICNASDIGQKESVLWRVCLGMFPPVEQPVFFVVSRIFHTYTNHSFQQTHLLQCIPSAAKVHIYINT